MRRDSPPTRAESVTVWTGRLVTRSVDDLSRRRAVSRRTCPVYSCEHQVSSHNQRLFTASGMKLAATCSTFVFLLQLSRPPGLLARTPSSATPAAPTPPERCEGDHPASDSRSRHVARAHPDVPRAPPGSSRAPVPPLTRGRSSSRSRFGAGLRAPRRWRRRASRPPRVRRARRPRGRAEATVRRSRRAGHPRARLRGPTLRPRATPTRSPSRTCPATAPDPRGVERVTLRRRGGGAPGRGRATQPTNSAGGIERRRPSCSCTASARPYHWHCTILPASSPSASRARAVHARVRVVAQGGGAIQPEFWGEQVIAFAKEVACASESDKAVIAGNSIEPLAALSPTRTARLRPRACAW